MSSVLYVQPPASGFANAQIIVTAELNRVTFLPRAPTWRYRRGRWVDKLLQQRHLHPLDSVDLAAHKCYISGYHSWRLFVLPPRLRTRSIKLI